MANTQPKEDYYNTIESERIRFRPFNLSDIDDWTPFFDRNDYQRFLAQDTSIPGRQRSESWIKRQIQRKEEEREHGQLAVIEKSSGAFIGVGGIIGRAMDHGYEYEITYSILPKFWGKGYATELAGRFIEYAREHIETNSVISIIHTENEASVKVAEHNGLQRDATTEFMGMSVYIYRLTF